MLAEAGFPNGFHTSLTVTPGYGRDYLDEAQLVQRVQVQWKRRFHKAAAVADFLHRERLENHHLAVQLSENLNPLAVSLFVRMGRAQRPVV